jgi:hypothetical protein
MGGLAVRIHLPPAGSRVRTRFPGSWSPTPRGLRNLEKNPVAGESEADAAAISRSAYAAAVLAPPIRCDRYVSIRTPEDEGVGAAGAVAETPAERWRFSGGRDSETGSGARDPCWRPSERWRSGWDGEFESPLLQQAVCLSGERRGCTGKARHFGGILRVAGDVRKDVQAANRASFALSL